ncbi:hypothetical protein EXIGLDRAFT_837075 [Exidia glandulosa HHB12029]|uniref:Uncharacterized protein n=1 Tax=Exidia glandulosa HHB12029 TaxID=1314781 RepID=A0A165H602_EXIGL|nr:hypothetical protein EXIGLDRAFT_837075 [Exidia glandulosa HHB12029]
MHPTMNLQSVLLTPQTQPPANYSPLVLDLDWLSPVPRNRVLYTVTDDPFFAIGFLPRCSQGRWLVFDAFWLHPDTSVVYAIPRFVETLADFLANLPRAERLLLRSCIEHDESRRAFCDAVAFWASTARDPRIWLDDDVEMVNWDNGRGFDDIDIACALAGHDFWLRGVQLYTEGN